MYIDKCFVHTLVVGISDNVAGAGAEVDGCVQLCMGGKPHVAATKDYRIDGGGLAPLDSLALLSHV